MELKVTRIYSQLDTEGAFSSERSLGVGEGGRGSNLKHLIAAFPLVSLVSAGSWGFSITGFLIRKLPARKIKLNRQYKHNKKSIPQLTFLLYGIERLNFRFIQLRICAAAQSCDQDWREDDKLQGTTPQNYMSRINGACSSVHFRTRRKAGNFPFAKRTSST